MNRRGLLIRAGSAAAIAHMTSVLTTGPETACAAQTVSASATNNASIRVADNKVSVDTKTLSATIDKGFITSLKSKITGEESTEGLERAGGCNLNEVLFGKLCRTIGYSGLGGRNKDEELRMRIHLEHGAIPTVTIRSAQDIIAPNPAVKQMLEIAAG